MPKYTYVARDAVGRQVKGSLKALDEREVVHYLRKQRLTAEKVNESLGILNTQIGSGSGVKAREVMTFTRMMSTFIRASVPLNSALDAMAKQAESVPMQRVIKRLIIGVESGKSLSSACKEQPKVFDDIFVNMIAAGETSGHLDTLMDSLAVMMERNDATKSKVKGAMVYPMALGVFATGAIIILLTFVLPNFIKMFSESHVALPLPTRITIGASDILLHYWYYLLGGIATIYFGNKQLMKNPKIAFNRDKLFLMSPVFGALILKSAISRFARTLSTLIGSGVPIIEALSLVGATTTNRVIAKAIADTRIALASGRGISETLDRTKIFPPLVVSMVDAGEKTGGLQDMLSKVADYYEMDVNRAVEGAIKLIEPAMMAIFGALIGLILMSIYLPMFNMLEVLKNS